MNGFFTKQRDKWVCFLFIILSGLGLFLRFYHYLMGRSLWEDEAHLALNFISRDFISIFQPLDYLQAAPPLFLLSVKVSTFLFGYGERSLRLVPFLFSVGTMPLIYFIARDLLKNKMIGLIVYALFSVNLAFIYFSSELKTYGVDVAMWLILVWLFVSQNRFILKWRNELLIFSGIIMSLYSNVTFIVMTCIGFAMLLNWIKIKKISKKEIILLIIWFITYLVYYFLFLYHHPHQEIQTEGWFYKMPPSNIFTISFWIFIGNNAKEISSTLLYIQDNSAIHGIVILLFVIGVVVSIKKKYFEFLIFCIAPLSLHFLISMLHLYPFWYRFILYTIPGLLFLLSYGIYETIMFINKYNKTISVLCLLIFMYTFSIQSLDKFPLWYREIRPVINYMNKHYPNHKVFITTPFTLYKYYHVTGVAENENFEAIDWSISPEEFTTLTFGVAGDFLLLHATNAKIDGYGRINKYLQQNKKIQQLIENQTYKLSLVIGNDNNIITINTRNFDNNKFDLNGREVMALWDNNILLSDTIMLTEGKYLMTIISKGTAADNIYPFIDVFLNGSKAHSFYTTHEYKEQDFYFEQQSNTLTLGFQMTNDLMLEEKNEDRNAFILTVIIKRYQ